LLLRPRDGIDKALPELADESDHAVDLSITRQMQRLRGPRTRSFRHPAAGLLTFTATEFDVPTSPDIRMVVHTPRDEQTWARLPLTRCPASSRATG